MFRLPSLLSRVSYLAARSTRAPYRGLAESFQRTKPHLNVGTIGHVDHGKVSFLFSSSIIVSLNSMLTNRRQLLLLQLPKFSLSPGARLSPTMTRSTKHQKKRSVELRFLLLMLNTKQIRDIMLTSIALVMQTTSRI